jgi:hypothetical protein
MRTTIAAVLAAVTACCGGSMSSGDLQTQSRNALPTSDNVKMSSPSTAASLKDGSDGTLQQADTVGSASDYFNFTVSLSNVVNNSTAVMLGLIKTITDFPATNCDAKTDTCTWGPFAGAALDANNYELVVVKQSEGHFTYALSGQAKANASGPFITFVSGTAVAGNSPHVGSGELVIDNDARAQLPGGNDIGKITIDYSNVGPLTISATAKGVKDNDHPGQTLNIGYQYANHTDGGGDLDVAFRNNTSLYTLSLHSRWQVSGAGRGDAKIQSGNGSVTITESECWAAAAAGFTLEFLNGPNGTSGSASACVFTDVQFGSVAPPQ